VAIARPAVVYAVVIMANALLLPLGKGLVVCEIVSLGAGSNSPEHLINLGLCRPTGAYRIKRVLLDTADHGGVGRPAIHRGRLRQDYGTARRVGVVRRPTRVGVMCSTSRATGHEDPPK